MSEQDEHTHTCDEGQDPTRIENPREGLARMRDVLSRLLKLPKSAIKEDAAKRADAT